MMQRQLWFLLLVATAFLLALASIGASTAQVDKGAKKGIFGVVTEVGTDTLTVQVKDEALVLKIDAGTKIAVPGLDTAALSDIEVGDRVAVLSEQTPGSGNVPQTNRALKITVVPAEPKDQHLTLTIVEVSGDTVIGTTRTGQQVVVELDFELSEELKGKLVTFIGQQPESNRFKAKAIMKLENVITRLDGHAKEKERQAAQEQNAQAKAEEQRRAEELKARLEALLNEHLDRFQEVIANAPEQARPALARALENFKKASEEALHSIGRSAEKVRETVDLRKVQGLIESYDPVTGQLVILTEGGASVTVTVVAATQVKIGDAAATTADIHPQDRVVVKFNPQTGEAVTVQLKIEAEVKGSISAVDAGAGALTLQLADGATITLRLAAGARIEINDQPAGVASLTVGMVVEVEYNPRNLEIGLLEAKLVTQLELIIDSVDLQAGTLVGHTTSGRSVTVRVVGVSRVEAKGAVSSLQGLQPGMQIHVEINPVTGEALTIKVASKKGERKEPERLESEVRGLVVRVDLSAQRLTVQLPAKSELTVTITATTEMTVGGQVATLASFKEGDSVRIEFDPQTKIALEIEKQGRGKEEQRPEPKQGQSLRLGGTLTAVDPALGAITVFTKDGEVRVLTVRADTAMTFNGQKIVSLSELPTPAAVSVVYGEGNVAIKIDATKKGEAAGGQGSKKGSGS